MWQDNVLVLESKESILNILLCLWVAFSLQVTNAIIFYIFCDVKNTRKHELYQIGWYFIIIFKKIHSTQLSTVQVLHHYSFFLCFCFIILQIQFLFSWLPYNFKTAVPCLCCCCSVTKLRLTLHDPMDCSTPGDPVLHCLPGFAQIHVHWVSDAIQPSHPLPPPSPALNLAEHQSLFQWVGSFSHLYSSYKQGGYTYIRKPKPIQKSPTMFQLFSWSELCHMDSLGCKRVCAI